MNDHLVLLALKDSLMEIFVIFKNNPFDFFYEEDVRALLFSLIYQKLENSGIKRGRYKIDKQFDALKKIADSEKLIRSTIVKTEYPYNDDTRQRFDISILKNESDQSTFYLLKSAVGIEIKLGCIETKMNQLLGFRENISSLKKYRDNEKDFIGIAIYFYQTSPDLNTIDKLKIADDKFMSDWIPQRGKVYGFLITGDAKIYFSSS